MYWVAYLDNFYTTIPLLGRLRHDYRIGGCGTARPSSAGFPDDLKIPKQNIAKFEYHSSKARVVTDPIFNQQVDVLLWFDNAPVTIMTTVHRLDAEVLRTGTAKVRRRTRSGVRRRSGGTEAGRGRREQGRRGATSFFLSFLLPSFRCRLPLALSCFTFAKLG